MARRGWRAGGHIQPLHQRRFLMDHLHGDVSHHLLAKPTAAFGSAPAVGNHRPRRLNLIQAN